MLFSSFQGCIWNQPWQLCFCIHLVVHCVLSLCVCIMHCLFFVVLPHWCVLFAFYAANAQLSRGKDFCSSAYSCILNILSHTHILTPCSPFLGLHCRGGQKHIHCWLWTSLNPKAHLWWVYLLVLLVNYHLIQFYIFTKSGSRNMMKSDHWESIL